MGCYWVWGMRRCYIPTPIRHFSPPFRAVAAHSSRICFILAGEVLVVEGKSRTGPPLMYGYHAIEAGYLPPVAGFSVLVLCIYCRAPPDILWQPNISPCVFIPQ